MIHKICVITGTRAEYGLLRNLLYRLKGNPKVELQLVVTGSHLCKAFGNTQDEIRKDGFSDYIRVPIPIGDDSKSGMAYATGVAMKKFAEFFSKNIPEIVIVLGDRFEIFAAASAAYLSGIRVAHIAGGDVTEGAVDDAIRHCLTKMANIHFPGCERAARRIIQMGEQPDTVFNVGEPGVENCLKLKLLSREELADNIQFDGILKKYSVVTFHPVTMEDNTAKEQVYELINAMDKCPEMSYIITMANADAGGRTINGIWMEEGEKHNNWLVVTSLGVMRYLSAVKYAKMVIGNSSSGLIEAPALGIPTINIGDRQKGRMIAESVLCCNPSCNEIVSAINEAGTEEFQEKAKQVKSPFGDGTTSEQIENIIMKYLDNKCVTNEKHFYDLDF